MSYQSEVIADEPLVYYPLDQTGDANSGDELTDLSGEDRHAALCYGNGSGSHLPYGWPSGIETSPSSRSFYAFSNNTSHVGGGTYSYAWRADGDLILSGDFVLECWVNSLSDVAAATNYPVFGVRGVYRLNRSFRSSPGAGEANFYFSLVVTLSDASTHTVTAELPVFNNTWYHVVGGRVGNSIFIRVNVDFLATETVPALANSGGSGTALSLTPCNPAGNSLVVGGLPFNDVHSDVLIEECALYESLSAARILAHYTAAKLSLPISATIMVRAAVTLDTDVITPTAFPFSHNFGVPTSGAPVPVKETLMYNTWAGQSQPDYQQRVNQYPHAPEREIDYRVTVNRALQRQRFHSNLFTPGQTFTAPVWTDWTVLTGQATAGASSLSLDTTLRDFEVGSYVGICSDTYDPETYQFFQISSVSDSALGITPNVGSTVANASAAFPARLMTLEDDSLGATSHTRDRETFGLKFKVLPVELSTRRLTAYTPTETYRTLERFALAPAVVDWLDEKTYELKRRQEGSGDRLAAVDTGSPRTIPVRVTLTTRAELSEFYGWLDARQGKQNPLWVSSGQADFTVTARTVSTVTVTDTGYELHDGRRDVEFLKTNGDYVRCRITGVTDNGATLTLTLDDPPPLLADISRTSFLYPAVCASDVFELTYTRNGAGFVAECSWAFVTLLTSPA